MRSFKNYNSKPQGRIWAPGAGPGAGAGPQGGLGDRATSPWNHWTAVWGPWFLAGPVSRGADQSFPSAVRSHFDAQLFVCFVHTIDLRPRKTCVCFGRDTPTVQTPCAAFVCGLKCPSLRVCKIIVDKRYRRNRRFHGNRGAARTTVGLSNDNQEKVVQARSFTRLTHTRAQTAASIVRVRSAAQSHCATARGSGGWSSHHSASGIFMMCTVFPRTI